LLVLWAQGEDAEAFAALVRRWQRRLFRHAFHLTNREDVAADVVQETWLAVVRGIRRLQDPACFPRWFLQIASRKCGDWVRIQKQQRNLVEHLANGLQAPTPQGEIAEQQEDIARLRQGLRCLPGDRRALLSMFYLDGLSIAEIAQAVEVPPGTVKSRLYHARQELKALLKGVEDERVG
jgi:RNA polymerase sigma-70 factor (ECF subfamily)